MPRRPYEGSGMLPGMDASDEPRAARPVDRAAGRNADRDDPPRVRAGAPKPPAKSVPQSRVRIAFRATAVLIVALAALYALHRTEQFLIRDSRFAMNGPEGSPETSTLEIRGAAHASARAIQAVFNDDSGRSVFSLPLDERRAALRNVDWVKDASIARVWPNRVLVKVAERRPVAFVPLTSTRFALIDDDGVILPPAPDRFHLPVLRGAHPTDADADRRERVRRMQRLLQDLGPMSEKISEIDLTEKENLKVKQPYEGRMVTLLLGDRNYASRYRNFLNHYNEIKQKLPDAATLDLRLEDRITVVEP
jgi:cell division protein FtsQ